MGQIANDMIDGFCCSDCGIYFVREHGFPVLCKDCFEDTPPDERSGIPMATEVEMGDDIECSDNKEGQGE